MAGLGSLEWLYLARGFFELCHLDTEAVKLLAALVVGIQFSEAHQRHLS